MPNVNAWVLIRRTGSEWLEDKVPRLGAALAYYSIFSMGPLILIVIAIAGLVFDRESVTTQLTEQIQGVVGEETANTIRGIAERASHPASSVWALAMGIIILLLGAAGVFGQLQDALNTIWEVKPKAGRGILGIVRDRFLSLTMVCGIGFLLLVSLVVSTAISAMSGLFGTHFGATVASIANAVASFVVITLMFAMMFKVLPDAVISWSDVWIGAVVTALLFTIGKFLIGLYLATSAVANVFGAAGSFVIVLIWVYYSAQILLLGAEFTQVYANQFGTKIRPTENAESVRREDRVQQGLECSKESR
jgi:membrane protein